MIRALVIGAAQRELIDELRATAADNVVDSQQAVKRGSARHRHRMALLTIELPVGFRVTFSHETHSQLGLLAHLSISIDNPGKLPDPAVVQEILWLFGMLPMQTSLEVWIEDVADGRKAVNILQPLNQQVH